MGLAVGSANIQRQCSTKSWFYTFDNGHPRRLTASFALTEVWLSSGGLLAWCCRDDLGFFFFRLRLSITFRSGDLLLD